MAPMAGKDEIRYEEPLSLAAWMPMLMPHKKKPSPPRGRRGRPQKEAEVVCRRLIG